jgi:hypothetical protein
MISTVEPGTRQPIRTTSTTSLRAPSPRIHSAIGMRTLSGLKYITIRSTCRM